MEDNKEMTFWAHLEDLRWALMRVVGVLFVLLVVCFCFMPYLFEHVVLAPTTADFPLYCWLSQLSSLGEWFPDFGDDNFKVEIINIQVASQFMTHITTSFWFALVLMFPYLGFEIWHFIQPALFQSERRSVSIAFVFGTFMFFLGCFIGYLVIFPFTFRFLTEYELSTLITNQISLNSYMSNFLMSIIVMGIIFELPLLVWLLSHLGLVTREMLQGFRKHAIVVLLVLAAFITPSGDPFTLMVTFLPIYALYEVGIRFAKKAEQIEDDEENDDNDDEPDTTEEENPAGREPSPAEKTPADNASEGIEEEEFYEEYANGYGDGYTDEFDTESYHPEE